jgi:GntR family transcriptional regulator/MocR family aminotransferase
MSKPAAGAMLSITLTPSSEVPLFHQVYSHIRDAILGGGLRPGSRLPSSRTLAADLGVSRTTVLNAFDELTAEGFLESRVGSGTRIASTLPEALLRPDDTGPISSIVPTPTRAAERPLRLKSLFPLQPMTPRPFQAGNPDLSTFPRHVWARLAAKHWRRAPAALLGYGDAKGLPQLRAAIADYAHRIRGVRCQPDQVLIVGGSQQALYLCGQVLLARNDVVWMEDPGYPGARAVFMAAEAKVIGIPVDDQGLVVGGATKNLPIPQLVCVTPSHQCPLGVPMSLSRRLELLGFAARTGAWIVEDDYDSEYQYFSRPLTSLQSLDAAGRVVYVGTLSKTLLPALRVGYVIVPEALADAFVQTRAVIDRQPAGGVEQLVLADFIAQGWLERHIRQNRARYLERQQVLVDSIRQELPDLLDVSPTGAGMYLTAWLKNGINDVTAAQTADAAGVTVVPLSRLYVGPARREGLVLGYGAFDIEQIRGGIKTLSRVLRGLTTVGQLNSGQCQSARS